MASSLCVWIALVWTLSRTINGFALGWEEGHIKGHSWESNRGFKAGLVLVVHNNALSESKQEAEPRGSLQRTAVNKQQQPYKQEVLRWNRDPMLRSRQQTIKSGQLSLRLSTLFIWTFSHVTVKDVQDTLSIWIHITIRPLSPHRACPVGPPLNTKGLCDRFHQVFHNRHFTLTPLKLLISEIPLLEKFH